jgi:hypothetical protein
LPTLMIAPQTRLSPPLVGVWETRPSASMPLASTETTLLIRSPNLSWQARAHVTSPGAVTTLQGIVTFWTLSPRQRPWPYLKLFGALLSRLSYLPCLAPPRRDWHQIGKNSTKTCKARSHTPTKVPTIPSTRLQQLRPPRPCHRQDRWQSPMKRRPSSGRKLHPLRSCKARPRRLRPLSGRKLPTAIERSTLRVRHAPWGGTYAQAAHCRRGRPQRGPNAPQTE